MHLHTLVWEKRTPFWHCEGCDLRLRFATYGEACFVNDTGAFATDGPMFVENGVVVVPLDFAAPVEYAVKVKR